MTSVKKLTRNTSVKEGRATILDRRSAPFRLAIERQLDNGYSFKDLRRGGIGDFHQFIEDTVGAGLSVTEVEKLYLRKQNLKKEHAETISVNGEERQILHFGKDRKSFRLFGYYAGVDFVILRIDCNHKSHREK